MQQPPGPVKVYYPRLRFVLYIPPQLREKSGLGSIRPHILAAMGRLTSFHVHRPPVASTGEPIPPVRGKTISFFD
ncbi:MAG: hypothetical protein ACPG9H_07780, partial [Candidatus Puniceispirillaceae bacterium]